MSDFIEASQMASIYRMFPAGRWMPWPHQWRPTDTNPAKLAAWYWEDGEWVKSCFARFGEPKHPDD